MQIGSMVRTGMEVRTEGYGAGGRTDVTQTGDYLADNEICEGRVVNGKPVPPEKGETPSFLWLLWEAVGIADKVKKDEAIEKLRVYWMGFHKPGSKTYHNAQARFFSMLTSATFGRAGLHRATKGCKRKAA